MAKQPRGLPRLQDLPSNTFFLDDSNTTLIKYTTPFTQSQNDSCVGGTCTMLGSAAASLEFSFNGTDVWLFGKPGGITRVFLDNQLVDVLDSSTLANNGSALWAATGLNQGGHTIKLGGVDGNGLNLLIDFFSVNGVVSAPSTSTDTNSLPPEKLTAIIIGSLVGFFALLAVIGISILLYVRRKKRRRISKSGIKLMSFDGSTGSGGRRSTSKIGLLNGSGGIFSGRPSTGDAYGGRVSNSTDGGNPFLKPQHAFTNSNTTTSAYSPPSSADASVPLFAQTLPQSQARRLSFIPDSTASSSYASMPSPPLQSPPQPPLEQQRQRQQQQLRTMNLTSVYPPKNGPLNPLPSHNEPEPKITPLMESPPPSYQQPQPRHLLQDPTFLPNSPETIKQIDYKITNLPPRGKGDEANYWSASKVPMASFSTTPTSMSSTHTTLPTPQTHTPTPQTFTRNARRTIPDAPESPPPPSFKTLETQIYAGPVPSLPTKRDNIPSKSPQLSSGKSLKGPRPRGSSNAQSTRSTATEEKQGLGVRSPAVASPNVVGLRPEDEEPESPVDPAVNFRSHWY